MTDEEAATIAARVEAATPGPWYITPAGEIVSAVARRIVADALVSGYALGPDAENADFIAHAREDMPALLADRAALLADRAALREIVQKVVDEPPDYEDHSGAGCCFFCGEMTRYNEHQPYCLLLKARAVLEGKQP